MYTKLPVLDLGFDQAGLRLGSGCARAGLGLCSDWAQAGLWLGLWLGSGWWARAGGLWWAGLARLGMGMGWAGLGLVLGSD